MSAIRKTQVKKRNKKANRGIPENIRCMLWGRAAGRCQFSGCRKLVSYHPGTNETVNLAEVAHIIGFSEDGPRGEKALSEKLAKDISNLMLLCGDCHKTIDTNKAAYPISLLKEMKLAHEHHIELVTGIMTEKQSHILLYGANVGNHSSSISYEKAAAAMIPEMFPASRIPLSLGMVNSSFKDSSENYWRIERTQLQAKFDQLVKPQLADGSIKHVSVFALAPQPLLMLLGFLLSDITPVEVYQLHREPQDWRWQEHPSGFEYIVEEPTSIKKHPALVLSLSATIVDERVKAVMGDDVSIWRVTIVNPNNDFLKSQLQLQLFRERIRPLLNRIKVRHGEKAIIHVFPAVPVAIAVEMGRIIMPKADLPFCVYDENKALGGFSRTLDLNDQFKSRGEMS
jgi:hypothetical protein